MSKFSQKGNFYAIFLPQIQSLRIANIEDDNIERMFQDIKDFKYYACIGKNIFTDRANHTKCFTDFDQDLSFVKSIEFDIHDRFIICIGET